MHRVWFGFVLVLFFVRLARPLTCFIAYVIDFAPDAPVVSEVAPQEPAHAHAHSH